MRKFIVFLALATTGCATHSQDIAATYVSPVQYQTYSCPQLREEAARISARAVIASGEQDSKANGDAVVTGVALVLFWPAAFLVKGNGTTSAELANLKGQMDAIEQASIQKKCGIEFRKS
jgi:hypothetical protein